MIRILFIHNKLVCGGAEQALYDLVSLLDKNRYDITVMPMYEGGEWEQKFVDAGIKVVFDHNCQIKSRNPFIKLRNLIKRKQILRARKCNGQGLVDICFPQGFDVIVAYHVCSMPDICFSSRSKSVLYIHSDLSTNDNYRSEIDAFGQRIHRFDQVICVSDMVRHSFEDYTNRTKHVTTIFNPFNNINVQALSLAPCPSLPNFPYPVICAVGRLGAEKGFDRLIFIHKWLLDKGVRHNLVIVGDGYERKHLQSIINGTRTQDSVFMVGYTPNPYPYMKMSKFLVCSSYTEGLPVIAMEALSLGIPVVSSAASVKELFGNSPCGIITESDSDSLCAGIDRLLTDSVLYSQVKAAAEQRSSYFEGKHMIVPIDRIFTELAGR